MEDEGLITRTGPNGETLDPPQDPTHPYVTVYMEGADPADTGLYYLVALTNSAKTLPNWHWYAIEHVGNRGRCDFIGCNDSFGYQAAGVTVGGNTYGRNYIPPHPLAAGDPDFHAPIGFGQTYLPAEIGETMTGQLKALFAGLGVGTAEADADPKVLDPADPAWRNYRLKGTQTKFTEADGSTTLVGASTAEGGFVNSSSCMTCHATASTDAYGNPGISSLGTVSRLNLFGFRQSASGAPDHSWFYSLGTPNFIAEPMDFIWGIVNAHCVADASDPDAKAKGQCARYEDVVLDRSAGAGE
jgi:hypothetical protein